MPYNRRHSHRRLHQQYTGNKPFNDQHIHYHPDIDIHSSPPSPAQPPPVTSTRSHITDPSPAQPPAITTTCRNTYIGRDLPYLITPLAASIHNRYCTADVVPSFYVTTLDAAFLNYVLRLMWPFSYTVDLFTYISYFSFPNLRSDFHATKV